MSFLFSEMELWFDPVERSGPEAMAVDEWLLETRRRPMLRVYGWDGEWGSLGYFGKISEAEGAFTGLRWVRRWTGGGVVDHRADWTYSLIVPRGYGVAEMRGGESYRAIHEVLVGVLGEVRLAGVGEAGGVCFENAVEFDVVDGLGRKVAGAGQRRTKAGLLHQGSVAVRGDAVARGRMFAGLMAEDFFESDVEVDERWVGELVEKRYGTREWLERR